MSGRFRGLFRLTSAKDLRDKLHRDFAKLAASPTSVDDAFNFFVTAWHILDWQYPERTAKERAELRDAEILLGVCAALANGAKHFVLDDPALKKHVASTEERTSYFGRYFSPRYFGRAYFGAGGLQITLQGEAATRLGATIDAVDLARQILAYWDNQAL
jgi:hypothetical protein